MFPLSALWQHSLPRLLATLPRPLLFLRKAILLNSDPPTLTRAPCSDMFLHFSRGRDPVGEPGYLAH